MSLPHQPVPGPLRPLVVTADPDLLDDALRLAAAAGVEVEVAAEPSAARRGWASAPLVLVGSDQAVGLARLGLPRRPDAILVSRDLDDAQVWRQAVDVGAENVVFLPDAESWLVHRLADAVDGPRAQAVTVCVVGGRGGAGATTLAASLALAGSRRGLRTMLVDGDPLGGGIDLALGGEDADGLRWPDLAAACGRVSGPALRESLPRVEDLTVLSWDRGDVLSIPGSAMQAVLGSARRSSDLVVVDLPRRLDDAGIEALRQANAALLLVPAEVRATAAAARVAAALSLVTSDLRLVVRGPAPSGLSADVVAESLGLPLAGETRAEPGIAAALERGLPIGSRRRGPLATLCGRLLDDLLDSRGRAAA